MCLLVMPLLYEAAMSLPELALRWRSRHVDSCWAARAARSIHRVGTHLLPGMVLALCMPLELIAIEVDLAQISGRVAAGLVIEVR
jgi:hypothetical protein